MDPGEDARLRLAAQRHPASRSIGTLHLAQHRLAEVVRAFAVVMREAHTPGARPLPPPRGRARWPRKHQARNVLGWPVPVPVEAPFQRWIDVEGRWWLLRFDAAGGTIDAHVVGTPLTTADDLARYAEALESILAACGVRH